MADYEQRSHAYTTSSSWYGHDVRRPLSWSNLDEMDYAGLSSYPVHPVPVDYSAAGCGGAPDAAAAAAAGWSLVDLKPCMTSCGLSAYTGENFWLQHTVIIWHYVIFIGLFRSKQTLFLNPDSFFVFMCVCLYIVSCILRGFRRNLDGHWYQTLNAMTTANLDEKISLVVTEMPMQTTYYHQNSEVTSYNNWWL